MPSSFGVPIITANRFGVPAAAQSWTLVTTLTASASTSLIYTGFSRTAYRTYAIVLNGLPPNGSASTFTCEGSIDGGATYEASWRYQNIYPSGATTVGTNGATGATSNLISQNVSATAAAGGVYGVLYLGYANVAGRNTSLQGAFTYYSAAGSISYPSIHASLFVNTTEINAMRFLYNGGTQIESGTIRIYGIT